MLLMHLKSQGIGLVVEVTRLPQKVENYNHP